MRSSALAFVHKNSSVLLVLFGIIAFVFSIAYVVDTLFIHPSPAVDFGIFAEFDFYRISGLFVLVIALGLLNMAIESYKWWYMSSVIERIPYTACVKSVLQGLAIGFITPNRLGDFPGRSIQFEKENRGKIMLMNLLSGYAQFMILCLLAAIAVFFLPIDFKLYFKNFAEMKWIYFTIFILLFTFHAYFFFRPHALVHFAKKIPFVNKFTHHLRGFRPFTVRQNFEIIHFSLLRSVLFMGQLMLILYFFQNDVPVMDLFFYSCIYFFILTIAPSFILNKIGIRESVSVLVFSDLIGNPVVIVVSVMLLWVINQVVPAIIGTLSLIQNKSQR